MKKYFFLIIIATVLMTVAQFLYKLGADLLPRISLFIFFAFFLYGFVILLVLFVLKKQELSYVYPLLATTFVWVALFSVFFLGESLSVFNWLGVLFIFAGASVIK